LDDAQSLYCFVLSAGQVAALSSGKVKVRLRYIWPK